MPHKILDVKRESLMVRTVAAVESTMEIVMEGYKSDSMLHQDILSGNVAC